MEKNKMSESEVRSSPWRAFYSGIVDGMTISSFLWRTRPMFDEAALERLAKIKEIDVSPAKAWRDVGDTLREVMQQNPVQSMTKTVEMNAKNRLMQDLDNLSVNCLKQEMNKMSATDCNSVHDKNVQESHSGVRILKVLRQN